eukprot:GHRR01005362.1.p1 GENE.GHRR01005362.1~~GHRR01005362.1.p1  ORF type:complete len:628 (+),score=249.95 GHRR01005362.1:1476-3359(+)
MRWVLWVPTLDEVAEVLVGILRREAVKSCCLVGHSYGTAVAARLLQQHPALIKQLCLIDPVCFTMFMPNLLRNFLYESPKTGSMIGDFMMMSAARDLHVSATLSRRFFWTDVNLWEEQVPADTLVVLSGKDVLMAAEEVKEWLETRTNAVVMYHPKMAHAGFVMDIPWQQQILQRLLPLLDSRTDVAAADSSARDAADVELANSHQWSSVDCMLEQQLHQQDNGAQTLCDCTILLPEAGMDGPKAHSKVRNARPATLAMEADQQASYQGRLRQQKQQQGPATPQLTQSHLAAYSSDDSGSCSRDSSVDMTPNAIVRTLAAGCVPAPAAPAVLDDISGSHGNTGAMRATASLCENGSCTVYRTGRNGIQLKNTIRGSSASIAANASDNVQLPASPFALAAATSPTAMPTGCWDAEISPRPHWIATDTSSKSTGAWQRASFDACVTMSYGQVGNPSSPLYHLVTDASQQQQGLEPLKSWSGVLPVAASVSYNTDAGSTCECGTPKTFMTGCSNQSWQDLAALAAAREAASAAHILLQPALAMQQRRQQQQQQQRLHRLGSLCSDDSIWPARKGVQEATPAVAKKQGMLKRVEVLLQRRQPRSRSCERGRTVMGEMARAMQSEWVLRHHA